VNFPLRVLLALVVICAFAGVGVWGTFVMMRAKSMTEPQRMMAVGGIVVLMATLAAWVISSCGPRMGLVALISPSARTVHGVGEASGQRLKSHSVKR
jgi:hypothetical protein